MTKDVVLYRDINKKSDFDEVLQIKGIDNSSCLAFEYLPPENVIKARSGEELRIVRNYYPKLIEFFFHSKSEGRIEGIVKTIYELEFHIKIIVPNGFPFKLPYGRAFCITHPQTLYLFNEYPYQESESILAFINSNLAELALKIVNERGNLNE